MIVFKLLERNPTTGKVSEISFKGLKFDNVQFATESGSKTIPGGVYAELGEMTKLSDGRIVQKAKVAVPTKSPVGAV